MNRRRLVLSILSLVLAMPLWLSAAAPSQQPQNMLPATLGNLITAQLIEVVDESGQVLLQGTLTTSSKNTDKTERSAELKSPSGQPAKGKVDIDISLKAGVVTKDEIELSLQRLPAMATCRLLVDGQQVSTFLTTKGGRADIKLSRKITTSAAR
jgi:hypothetical protein